jgi:hypothetical protein
MVQVPPSEVSPPPPLKHVLPCGQQYESVIGVTPLTHVHVPPLLLVDVPPLLLVDVPPLLLVDPPLLLVNPLLLVDPPLDPPLLVVEPLLLVNPLLLVLPPLPPDEELLVDVASFVSGSVAFWPEPIWLSTAPPHAEPTAERRRTDRKIEEGSRRSMRRAKQCTCRCEIE